MSGERGTVAEGTPLGVHECSPRKLFTKARDTHSPQESGNSSPPPFAGKGKRPRGRLGAVKKGSKKRSPSPPSGDEDEIGELQVTEGASKRRRLHEREGGRKIPSPPKGGEEKQSGSLHSRFSLKPLPLSPPKNPKTKFTEEETKLIKNYFCEHIQKGARPTLQECRDFLEMSKLGRSDKNIQDKVRNLEGR